MSDLPAKPAAKTLIDNQVVRFILSAGVGFIADVMAYYLFYHFVFTQKTYLIVDFRISSEILALAISFFIGVVINFLITRYQVFTESKLAPNKQFFRFASVAILGFFANLAILKVFVHYFHWYPPVARPAAALSLFFASFFVHKFFSFNLSLRPDESRNNNQ